MPDEPLHNDKDQPAAYEPVVAWNLLDRRRILPVPPGHWLLVQDSVPFRATLQREGGPQHVQSIAVRDGHIASFSPMPVDGSQNIELGNIEHRTSNIEHRMGETPLPTRSSRGEGEERGRSAFDALLSLERYTDNDRQVTGQIRFLAAGPDLDSGGGKPLEISNLPALRDIASTSREVKSEAKATLPLDQPLVLLTNGIGGMARLCVDFGRIKSKYDCLLGANLNGRVPVDRHIFAKRARLWVNAGGFITPLDLRNLASFTPGPPAVWLFVANAGDGRTVEIMVTASMLPQRNSTVLHFARPVLATLKRENIEHRTSNIEHRMGTPPHPSPLPQGGEGENSEARAALSGDTEEIRLTVRVDIEDRNFHWETKRNSGADYHFSSNSRPLAEKIGFLFTPAADRQLRVFSDGGVYHHQAEWSENIPHPVEQSRGQTGSGDAYSPGWFEIPLLKGASVSLVVSADADDPTPEVVQLSKAPLPVMEKKSATDKTAFADGDQFGQQLLRAAECFVVRRDDGVTVIAGYPWFLDWGRDSLISARGLLAAGMTGQVKQLLLVFGRFEKDGTLPNTIHGDDASNRDTSDAPLWYGMVCEDAAASLGAELYEVKVDNTGRTLADVLADIATNYARGTPNGIRMDAKSGLIWSPSHFTWMDTNYPAATPREGYPIEIQVLWIRLLRQLERIGRAEERKRWRELAELAQASLQKYFWLEERGYLADLLIAKAGQSAGEAIVDNALRSNCLLAVSLGLITGKVAQRCVAAATRYLVVPGALRSLAPLPVSPPLPVYGNQGQLLNNPPEPYWGRYEGDEDTRRKPAYHNGTAWTWTFPIYCEALARAWDFSPEAVAAAKAYLGSMDRLLMENCVGQIPEVIDGDTPHAQRGCDAQAWGVTEALRVWKLLQNTNAKMVSSQH